MAYQNQTLDRGKTMQIIFYLLSGVALAVVGDNQLTVMTGDMESAIMGYAGAAMPFFLVGLAYGAGRWER